VRGGGQTRFLVLDRWHIKVFCKKKVFTKSRFSLFHVKTLKAIYFNFIEGVNCRTETIRLRTSRCRICRKHNTQELYGLQWFTMVYNCLQ
jgi:hypothetical protein